jgi:hypothetical protein
MLKSTELALLRETADRLGSDSYCGPWLSQQIPFVEFAIRSDFMPDVDIRKTAERCEQMVKDCDASCMTQRKMATKEADAIIASARAEACAIRGRVLAEMRKCMQTLGVSL